MPIQNPLTYLRQRRDQAQFYKPTIHTKVAKHRYLNPQSASPFFSQIPAEIRHLIYEFALLASPDPLRPFSKHSWHYRPGYTHARYININLLLTCRRIYLEADHLAVSLNEHLIYSPVHRGPPGNKPYLLYSPSTSSSSNRSKRRGHLKHAQRERVQQVHIFAPQLWLEDWNFQWRDYCKSWSDCNFGIGDDRNEHPPRLKITMRHTDWWYFLLGENSPLALDAKFEGRSPPRLWIPDDAPFMPNSWGSRFKLLRGLQVFELELETLQHKKEELDAVIERAYGWRFPLPENKVLVCDCDATDYMSWTGSRYFDGLLFSKRKDSIPAQHGLQGRGMSTSSSSTSRPSASRKSSIATFTKKKTTRSESESSGCPNLWPEEEDLPPECRLEYYVVTLTYRAQDEKGKEREVAEGEDEEIGTGSNAIGNDSTATPAPAPAVSPAATQGLFPPRPWVPMRSGFPTAYG